MKSDKNRVTLPNKFVNLSYRIGLDHLMVQGAGGNTSYKQDGRMWIKASGKWLINARKEDIFVLVDFVYIRDNITKNKSNALEKSEFDSDILRPSIETTLHALMPHKVVIHTHPIELLSWIVREGARENLTDILSGVSWAWVPYARPGVDLTYAIQKVLYDKKVDVLVLGNHGLVVGGIDCSTATNLMKKVLSYCEINPRAIDLKDMQSIGHLHIQVNMRLPKYSLIHSLALDDASYKFCSRKNGVLYPDQAVFLGSTMLCYDELNSEQSIDEYIIENNYPLFVIIKDKGVLVSNNARVDVDEMLRCHAEVLMRISANEKLHYLTEDEVCMLLDWEPEKYRRTLSK